MQFSNRILFSIFALFMIVCCTPFFTEAALTIGIGKTDITPPIGTPSAGYRDRNGEGMSCIHDPLLATALFINNGEKQIVLCSVDHLGFTYDMVQEIINQVHQTPQLAQCEVYIGSSHTHSGGGAYLNIPLIGASLAGPYNPDTTKLYIDKTVEAIVQAGFHPVAAKIGIGYGNTPSLSQYRSQWPKDVTPLSDVSIIKVTDLNNTPLAVLFNFPVHPTVLPSQNRLFSADFVGYSRDHLQTLLGNNIQAIYFNGAQGDINPVILNPKDPFNSCQLLGTSLAESVKHIWDNTETSNDLDIKTLKTSYSFKPQPTPFGLTLPINSYSTEMNLLVLNKTHAFITIPGELSCIYDRNLKDTGKQLGFSHVSFFGLTNDAHGYIILPDSWRHKTFESGLSFGGEHYGETTQLRAEQLLKNAAP